MTMKQFQSKPVTVQAIRFDGTNIDLVKSAVANETRIAVRDNGRVEVLSNHGWVHVGLGDWILQQADGELYPCNAELFASKYAACLEIPAHLPEHMKRVHIELLELVAKLSALGAYLIKGGEKSSPEELELQQAQFDHMEKYADTLKKRLALYAGPSDPAQG